MPVSPSQRAIAIVGLSLMAVAWGCSFAAMKVALDAGLSVGAMLTARFTLAALILWVALWWRGGRIGRRALLQGSVLGLLLAAILWLQSDGLRFTTTSKSGFITGLYVLFTPLVGLLWKERLERSHVLGALMAVVGLWMLVSHPGTFAGGWNRGDIETLLCAAGCGFHIVLTGRWGRETDGWALAFTQVAVVALLSWILAALLPVDAQADGTRFGGLDSLLLLRMHKVWIAVAYQAVFATALAFLLMSLLQPRLGATEAAIIYAVEPVVTLMVAMSGWIPGIREHLSPLQLTGAALILLAMVISQWRSRQTLPDRDAATLNDGI